MVPPCCVYWEERKRRPGSRGSRAGSRGAKNGKVFVWSSGGGPDIHQAGIGADFAPAVAWSGVEDGPLTGDHGRRYSARLPAGGRGSRDEPGGEPGEAFEEQPSHMLEFQGIFGFRTSQH